MVEIVEICVGLVVLLLGVLFYRWGSRNYDYFKKRGIPEVEPDFLLGSTGRTLFGLRRVENAFRWIYNYHPTARAVGIFQFRQPVYLIRDPALIKHLAVKDFDCFSDHKLFIDPDQDELFGNSLIMMRGQKWKEMRATLSPAFTGNKMRTMFAMVNDCALDAVRSLRDKTAAAGSSGVLRDSDMKDLFRRYATDVIATAAFGLKVNSFDDEHNEFFVHGKQVATASLKMVGKILMLNLFPLLMRKLDIQFIDPKSAQFFRTMTLDTIHTRLAQKIHRPDLIDLLMHLKVAKRSSDDAVEAETEVVPQVSDSAGFATVEESHIGKRRRPQRLWTDNELTAQCFLFFAAGFDTTSTILSFLSYELALNVDVQQKLFEECQSISDKLAGEPLTYETLQQMQYMDQVVSETMRMWPPVPFLDRMCVRDYKYDDGRLQFDVQKGMSVWFPVFGLHHDEQYFAEPERFRPERFGAEERDSIKPGTYLPFGIGPRNCIGSRFALMEVKAMLYHLILHFNVDTCASTPIPIKLGSSPGVLKPKKPIVLSLTRRNK